MESKELMIAQDPQISLQRKEVATGLFKSGLFPNAKNEYGAYAIVQYGAELGIAPMVALQNINIINGKLVTNGQVMLSLALSRGVTYQVLEETEKICSIKFTRGANQYISHFSVKDAEVAGLTGKDNWRKWIKDMLWWRCVAKGVRRIAPEAVMGLYTADEITDGEVVDVADYRPEPELQAIETPIPEPPPHDEAAPDEFADQFEPSVDPENIEYWRDVMRKQTTKKKAIAWAKGVAPEIKTKPWHMQFREEFAMYLAGLEDK